MSALISCHAFFFSPPSPPNPGPALAHWRSSLFLAGQFATAGRSDSHVILQWCVERIQPGVPRHRTTTNQTGFQQHEKYTAIATCQTPTLLRISPSRPQTTSLNVTRLLQLLDLTTWPPSFNPRSSCFPAHLALVMPPTVR